MSDVIIVGGGPAGSTMGCYLSMMGISNTIIEEANHPRPHVGESMITSSTPIFEEIGMLETMEAEGFVKKYGASWHVPDDKRVVSIAYAETPQPGVNQDYTYHVDRGRLDLLMLKRAEELGSNVHQGVRVNKVLFDGDRACGVRCKFDGREVDLSSKVVVDASGGTTLLGHQLGIKKNDTVFDQYAVHAWFKGLTTWDDTDNGNIHIYFLPIERGWVWQIPITEEITSVGVVVRKNEFKKSKADIEAYFLRHIQSNLNLSDSMRTAERINEFTSEGDYTYSMKQVVGDGFVLIGDAARFVDPIFSSGATLAMSAAKFASEYIKKAFDTDDFSRKVFQPYEDKLGQGANIWYEFIRLYYRLAPAFTYFIKTERYRAQVLQLLRGEVFDRNEVPVLDEMAKFIETVENSENHLFKDQLRPAE